MSLALRTFQPEDAGQWDAFVEQHPCGTVFHLTAWKNCIEESFGYRSEYLVAAEGRDIRGVLPIFLVQNPILKKALISVPFAVSGGILADSPEVREALFHRVKELGQRLGVEYIDLRNYYPQQAPVEPNVDRYSTFTKTVCPSEEALFESLPKKTRNMVRKALKTPFQTRIATGDISNFEKLHSITLRRLGTPCFPKLHFRRILKYFKDKVDVREVVLDGQVMAVSMNFFLRGNMHTYYAAADPAQAALAPNTFMYFDHLRWAGQNGFKEFEFGRSKKGTGPYEFKTHWGNEMRDLPYNIVLVRGQEVPNYTQQNRKFTLATNLWKHVPMPVARVLGPHLITL